MSPSGSGPTDPRHGRVALLASFAVILCFWLVRYGFAEGQAALGNSDLFLYYYPSYASLGQHLQHFSVPLWNPYQLCGTPSVAALQGGSFYPPNLIFGLLPTAWAMLVVTLGHLLLVAGATFVFMRMLGAGLLAALLAALLVAMGKAYPGQSFFPNMLGAAAWLPVGCIGISWLADGENRRSVALVAAAMGMSLLAGYPQASLNVAYGWAAVLAVLLAARRRPLAAWLRAYAVLFAAGSLGVGLAAVQLAPTFELLGLAGAGRGGGLAVAQMYPFGVPETFWGAAREFVVEAPGRTHLALGFGVAGIVLLPVAMLHSRLRPVSIGMLAIVVGWLVIALGPWTPLFEVWKLFPGLSWFRLPQRGLFVASFAFAVAVGLAVDATSRRFGAAPRRRAAVAATLALVVVGELLAARPSGLSMRYLGDEIEAYHDPTSLASVLEDPSERVWVREPLMLSLYPPKLATLQRVRSVEDYEPVTTSRQAEYFGFIAAGGGRWPASEQPFAGSLGAARLTRDSLRLLELAAVRHVAIPSRAALNRRGRLRRLGLQHRADVATATGKLSLYRNDAALPRAYVASAVRPAGQWPDLLAALLRPGFDPREVSYVEGQAPEWLLESTGSVTPSGSVRIVRDEATRVEVEASLRAPGLLVLADTHYPGWEATVDGEPAPILPTNHLFRGVALEAGERTVVFRYRPVSLWLGAISTLVTALLVLWLGLGSRRA